MLLKKVWGKVSAGLATVDIYTHYGTPEQTHIHQNIPVGDNLLIEDKLVLIRAGESTAVTFDGSRAVIVPLPLPRVTKN